MNRHKKIWLLLFILTFMLSCCSVTAWAQEITPEQVQQILRQQEEARRAAASAASSAVNSVPSSKAPLASSKIPNGSAGYPSSGTVQNGSSDVSSQLFSSTPESSKIILPSVNSVEENNPLSSVVVDPVANRKMKWIGILSWACIALGVLVVLIVVLSNRRPPSGGSGRKRYRRPSRTKKKRLLNEKYYRHTKY